MNTHDNNVSIPNETKFNAFLNEQVNEFNNLDSLPTQPSPSDDEQAKALEISGRKKIQARFSIGGGCISIQTLSLDMGFVQLHDDLQYQTALKELGNLYRTASETQVKEINATEYTTVKINAYDTMGFSTEATEFTFATSNITDDELEEYAYLGWLSI